MRWLLPLVFANCNTARIDDAVSSQAHALAETTATCATSFGTTLTQGYGRLDGTLLAVVPAGDVTCAKPDPDHVVLHVQAQGKAYRVLVNTAADRGPDGAVYMQAIEHTALLGPAFAEGWHTGVSFDYRDDFGLALADFAKQDIASEVPLWLELGAPISVFASTPGGSTLRMLHRSHAGRDGAVVIDPAGSNPVYLLFAFAGQDF